MRKNIILQYYTAILYCNIILQYYTAIILVIIIIIIIIITITGIHNIAGI
jgi:hypothetical protein